MRHHGQVYERLLDLDAPLELVPQLANRGGSSIH